MTPFETVKAIIPECIPLDESKDYTGLTLVVNPIYVKPEYRNREGLIWKVKGGFGTAPGNVTISQSTFADCVADGEPGVCWQRHEWVAEIPTK